MGGGGLGTFLVLRDLSASPPTSSRVRGVGGVIEGGPLSVEESPVPERALFPEMIHLPRLTDSANPTQIKGAVDGGGGGGGGVPQVAGGPSRLDAICY